MVNTACAPISWPLHSLDISLLYFFLCDYVKCFVLKKSVDDIGTLHARIIETIQHVG